MITATALRSVRSQFASPLTAQLVSFAIIVMVFVHAHSARAQFTKPIVILKGVVRSEDNGKPVSVRVSIRPVGDTAREITQSISNKADGHYTVILTPGKSYWVHLEGDSIMTKDQLITTPPAADRPQQVEENFSVTLREAPLNPDLRKEAAAN